jgi:UPF0716 protein FxsA
MNVFRSLFLLIIVISFLELYVLLAVGSVLGTMLTILLIIASAALGSFLLKQQGFATYQRFQAALQKNEVPAVELMEGFVILLGGALLLTPGFITDIVGLCCLFPPLRQHIIGFILERFAVPNPDDNNVLEGQFRKDTE